MSLYRPAGSRIWWFDFHFSGQRIRESTKMSSRTRARECEEKRKSELRDGAAGIRKREAPKLFAVAFAEYVEAKKAKWSTGMCTIAASALKHLAPGFGKRLACDIDARDINKYQKARLAEGASARTANIEIGFVRAVLKRSGYWARIQPHVELLPEREDAGRALSSDEESILLDECGKSRSRNLVPFVTISLETGARYSTVRKLQWKNVDFVNRSLKFGRDKTRSGSNRLIPLSPRALATLKFWAEGFPDRDLEHFVFPAESYGGSGADDVFGFTRAKTYETDPTRPIGSIKTAWETARDKTRYRCPECRTGRLKRRQANGRLRLRSLRMAD